MVSHIIHDEHAIQETVRERHRRFMDLYEPVSDRLARYVRAMTGDVDEALDLVSETVVIAYEKMDTVRNTGSFLGFILTIARNVHLRKRLRGSRFRPLAEMDAETFPALDQSPEDSADVRLLYDALAELPSRQREAVILFEIVGLPLEEVRAIQGGTLSGVKARVVRGRRTLAELLNPAEAKKPVNLRIRKIAVEAVPVGIPMRVRARS